MLNKDNLRELAYVVTIDEIRPIEGYDRVEYARVGGWWVIVRKEQFIVGDKAIYIEVDSKVPVIPPFEFLEKRDYKVKTLKMCKVISQGLLMSFEDFGWNPNDYEVGDFLTHKLGITYYEPGDNERKASPVDKYVKMARRHKKLFNNPLCLWMLKREWGRKVLFFFFGKKKDKRGWPSWVSKTDEERAQNLPQLFPGNNEMWIATEKIDGTSTTFTIKRGLFKNDFYVCSRNVVFDKPNKKCFYETNVYTEMAEKYHVEEVLNQMLKEFKDCNWITLQGETYGAGVQKRDYGMTKHNFRGFNLITEKYGRWNSVMAAEYMAEKGIPWVPIIDTRFKIPETCDELLNIATGTSLIDGDMREGLVFRSQDGKRSFKAVSNAFLLKYHQ